MRKVLGVAVASVAIAVVGCGGVAEVESGEVETVNAAKTIVTSGVATGSLEPGDAEKLREFMILCRDKPLSEVNGDSLREIMDELAPQLKGVDAEAHRKMDHLAETGCD